MTLAGFSQRRTHIDVVKSDKQQPEVENSIDIKKLEIKTHKLHFMLVKTDIIC